jgi:hypothetical protein
MENPFAGCLAALRQRIADAARTAGRSPEEITLVGISKTQPAGAVAAAIAAGLHDIGENRVQEAARKRPEVERLLCERGIDPKSVRWHMVGRLQTNKTTAAVEGFDVIQSVDSFKLAAKLNQIGARMGRQVAAMVEVNCCGEAAKAGIEPSRLMDFLEELRSLEWLKICGLMTIGPLTNDRSQIVKAFTAMARLWNECRQSYPGAAERWELSMGMSDDYDLAITAGATMIRIGTAIFGDRKDYDNPTPQEWS